MLTLYLTCLIGGGVFVALSVFSGIDNEADFGGDHDLDADLGEVEVDPGVFDGAGDADVSDFGHGNVADVGHGLEGSHRARSKRPWNPLLSFRFWTFGATFFGLTGTALTTLSLSMEPIALWLSCGVGLSVGTASAWVVHALRKPVGQSRLRADDLTGASGELLLSLKPAGMSKVRLQGGSGVHELIVVASEGQVIPKGTRVVVLGLDEEGRARVSPEQEFFRLEDE
jgi:hypothetical protein